VRFAEHAAFHQLIEQRGGVYRQQPRHGRAPIGHDDLLPGVGPLDPARQLGSQSADRDIHRSSVQVLNVDLYNDREHRIR
jgi:hypothetical protein